MALETPQKEQPRFHRFLQILRTLEKGQTMCEALKLCCNQSRCYKRACSGCRPRGRRRSVAMRSHHLDAAFRVMDRDHWQVSASSKRRKTLCRRLQVAVANASSAFRQQLVLPATTRLHLLAYPHDAFPEKRLRAYSIETSIKIFTLPSI